MKAGGERKERVVSDGSQMIRSKWSKCSGGEDVRGNISEDHPGQWLANWC